MAWSVGPVLTRLGASLQQVADYPQLILWLAAGGFLDAGCHWHASQACCKLGKTSGKQSLSDIVCVLTALQSSRSVASALHALQRDDSVWWAVFIVRALVHTMS